MAVIGDMIVNMTANTGQFQRKMREAQGSVAGVTNAVGQNTAAMGQGNAAMNTSVAGMARMAAAAAAVGVAYRTATALIGAFTRAVVSSVQQAASVEMLEVQLKTLTGSSQAAGEMMRKLREFAAATPFEVQDIAQAAKTMLGFGFSIEDVHRNLEMMAKLAATSGTSMNELADILGKVRGMNKLQAVEGNRLIDRQINIYQELANMTGKSVEEVRKMGEQGQISYAMVEQALMRMTTGQGQFATALEDTQNTAGALFSTLVDNVKMAAVEFGKFIIETFNLKDGMKGITTFIQEGLLPNLQRLLEGLKPIITAMLKLAEIGMEIGLVFADIFGEALLRTLEAMQPLLASMAEGVAQWAESIGAGVEQIRKAKELVFGNPLDQFDNEEKPGAGGILGGVFDLFAPRAAISKEFLAEQDMKKAGEEVGKAAASGFVIKQDLLAGATGGRAVPGMPGGIGRELVPKVAESVSDGMWQGFREAGPKLAGNLEDEQEQRQVQFAGAATAGSAGAFSSIVRNVFGRGSTGEKQLSEQKKTNDKLDEQNQLIKGSMFDQKTVESFT